MTPEGYRKPDTAAEEVSPPVKPAPSLFDKCYRFFEPTELYAQVKAADLYPYFRAIERNDGTRAIINGREVIMAGSNNYLGLLSDPRVKEAAQRAIEQYGTGCTGSRFLNGTLDLHLELEARLARFMGREAAVLFSTGYMTNQGVIQAIAGKGDIIFSDKDNHACIVAGTQVSLAETWRYRHNDLKHLRMLLEKAQRQRPEAGKLIVTDGVFSMSGTLARVPELLALAEEFGAALMLDDAHAVGVVGPGGRGSAAHFGLEQEVHLTTGTFSKSFASLGGFVTGDREVIEYIRHNSSAHIFSASMPPANVATVLKCLDILEAEPWRVRRLWEISDYMREGFRRLGFNVWTSQTPIIPVVVGDLKTCFRFWKDLLEEGVFVNAVVPPAVPQGQSLMRTSYMATHTDEELDFILEAFQRVGRKHGVIPSNGAF
ncbi:pyridoxal phosphate-dependent aminotransferase family protein [Rhodocaloribacter litoris]|uniref:aminotransferase class I/II-fold pyridoxal phosphate-dependent enzyme n=1 Tax=Rhodocaloribacter litoris TaxID=2558931 RepID=UPI00141EED75|nr:pyridoxal phosphate-dependent aminotransferase family protein [Rhodocaloribacter litoris]QXD14084.1 pyridoxal phosphate-dependent aminotransferase family protein [Rhodocaloribacter litoris]